LGRETFLAPVIWSEDGWPFIDNDEGKVQLIMGSEEHITNDKHSVFDAFNEENLGMMWNFIRNPIDGSWSMKERRGYLTLHGQKSTLSDVDQSAFVGRRLQHPASVSTVSLDFAPARNGEEAGLCLRMNERAHYEICFKKRDDQTFIQVLLTAKGESSVAAMVPYRYDGVLKLRIFCTETLVLFSYSVNGQWVELCRADAAPLAPEYAGGFTGVYAGMYATGNGRISETPAHFDDFTYEGLK
jgi:alpha-N-arabinofuranosidase